MRSKNVSKKKQEMQVSESADPLVHLSITELQRLPKPRSGFERWAAQIIQFAQRTPRLQSDSFDGPALLDELEMEQSLEPEVAQTAKKLAMLRETQLKHASNVWVAVLRIYERAKIEAKEDPEVEFAIAGFEEFMKTGKRKKAQDATPAAPPTVATPTATP